MFYFAACVIKCVIINTYKCVINIYIIVSHQNIAGFSGKLPVAVKTLTSIDEEDIKKFLDEVDLMKKFCHPNIVSLLGNYLD